MTEQEMIDRFNADSGKMVHRLCKLTLRLFDIVKNWEEVGDTISDAFGVAFGVTKPPKLDPDGSGRAMIVSVKEHVERIYGKEVLGEDTVAEQA